MSTELKKLPGVLSFQRCLINGDALFYNLFEDGTTSPLQVVRHGIMGTQNINKGKSKPDTATAGSTEREEVRNPQQTDSAKLDPEAKALQVRFTLRFLDLKDALFACAPGKKDDGKKDGKEKKEKEVEVDVTTLRKWFTDFVDKAKASGGLEEIARRYARNIANGRFLWRNRAVAQSVKVSVTDGKEKIADFDALAMPLTNFDDYSDEEIKLGEIIAAGLRGDRQAKLVVTAEVDFGVGGAVEVYPSQNYLEGKEKGFARLLYCVGDAPADQDKHSIREMGQAALRDQKIGNALRTIDTWYPSYSDRGLPIAVEPNGANLDAQLFFRDKKTSGFTLMLKMGSLDPDSEDGMFLLACLIRGGVFSGSDS